MARGDRLAGLRVGHQAGVGMRVVEVENFGQGVRGPRERGMVGDVGMRSPSTQSAR